MQSAVVHLLGQQQVRERARLLGVEHPELIQGVAGVVEQVGVDGGAMVLPW